MHLEEIILQGFKSYTSPVTITNLTKFTAITGLNGTGKSNIIDGIIFCLNLDTNKTLRIKKLEDLINTKCNEAIVICKFNTCTISRSISRDGKSKIYINNSLSTAKNLKKLLNMNNIQKNAQNVILQGNITKILNLNKNNYLVQETANIRVYMQEKEDALELITKKEAKLIDTKDILKRRAEPFIEKLRSERNVYVEMRRCEEMKSKNMKVVEENEKVLKENENNKKKLELKALLEEYKQKMEELSELKGMDERVASVDFNDVYAVKNEIEEMRRQLNILNVKINQSIKTDEKENIDGRKKRKSDTQRINLSEMKEVIDALKEKEKMLINEIFNKEAGTIGLNKENLADKLKNINDMKLERNKILAEKDSIQEINRMNLDDKSLSDLHKTYSNRLGEIENCKINKSELNILRTKHTNLISAINYPIFEGVHGTVYDNFTIKENKHKEIIDIILGARKKYVIVENEKIGTKLLEGAKQRINIIPLNKIKSNLDPKKEKLISKNNGKNCIHLINFDPQMKKAMEYIFGNYYVFDNKNTAKTICYKEKVPCISLDGNLYDPRGIVTGGKTKKYNDHFVKYSEIVQTTQVLNDLEKRHKLYLGSQTEYEKINRFLSAYKLFKGLEVKLKGLNDKISLQETFLNKNADLKKEQGNVKKLIGLKEFNYNKELERLSAEELQKKQKLEDEREIEAMGIEKRNLEQKILQMNEQLKTIEIQHERYSIYEKDKTILEDKYKVLSVNTSKLKKVINKLLDNIDCELITNTLQTELPDCFQNLNSKIVSIVPLLGEEMEILPVITEEDLKMQLVNAKRDLETLSKKQRKTMDPNNYEFLEKNEETIKFLEDKILRLESDKNKLISKIKDLNKQSEVELRNAHKHLNNEAGKYLKLFLPDSDIKLDDDYNIGVKISNWKNSVNELSGGQRSLVALSLIFAMLSYKPAPFYLFDEVDSALDISMTMNIGLCMKRFQDAQFIVVSLKEEFYRNANSIFMVYLNDGKTNVKKLK